MCFGSALPWQDARAQREHLIKQLSWTAAGLLVTRLCPVYLVDELVLVFYDDELMMMMMMMMIFFVVWLTDEKRLALFPAGTIARNLPHRESATHHEQGLSLCRT